MRDHSRDSVLRLAAPLIAVVAAFALLVGGCMYTASHSLDGLLSDDSSLPDPPPPREFGTRTEVGTRGDHGNPRVLFHREYPSRHDDQERTIGGLPARFSGYTTWVDSVRRVPASTLVDSYLGDFLRVRVRVFNRDADERQHVCACDFEVWSRAEGYRTADVVGARTIGASHQIDRGDEVTGDVYLYVGAVAEPLYIVYSPDDYTLFSTSEATGIWRVPDARGGPRSGDR